ncbi:MAG: hypothetical protein LBM00_08450 [Deltaproteobacteria bacterium]|jgi:hypothetical protein|nr:hypothetical protein [Deltaproteobacteria bacterium]
MSATLKQKVEGYLYRKGFVEPLLREIMLAQLVVDAALLVPALVFIWMTDWFLLFFAGSALATCNFWFLCRFVFGRFYKGYSSSFAWGQTLLFAGRFVFTGAILAGILLFGSSPTALLAGLGTCAGVIIATALLRFRAF